MIIWKASNSLIDIFRSEDTSEIRTLKRPRFLRTWIYRHSNSWCQRQFQRASAFRLRKSSATMIRQLMALILPAKFWNTWVTLLRWTRSIPAITVKATTLISCPQSSKEMCWRTQNGTLRTHPTRQRSLKVVWKCSSITKQWLLSLLASTSQMLHCLMKEMPHQKLWRWPTLSTTRSARKCSFPTASSPKLKMCV